MRKMNNPKIYPIKININLALSYDVEQFCRSVNQAMVEEGLNDINFKNDNHIPHITLLMGHIRSESDYLKLIQSCSDFASLKSEIKYKISKPYWKKPLENFVFVNILPLEEFGKFRLSLDASIKGLIDYSDHGSPDSLTHITLGYSGLKNPDNEMLIASFLNTPSGVADSIRICRAGSHGTCNEIFNEFHLSKDAIA